MTQFNLAVVQPVAGKPGKVVFTVTITASSINEAVKKVREEVNGSGWIVLQASQVQPNPSDVFADKLVSAYQKAMQEGRL